MKAPKRKKVVVGIDDRLPSLIAASILRNQDYDLVGVHLRTDLGEDEALYPSALRRSNLAAVEKACAALDMPLKVIDVTAEALGLVYDPYWLATLNGAIDAPELRWLTEVLLPHLDKIARQFGAGEIATGHFARRMGKVMRYSDPAFDQSLAFSRVDPSLVARMVLPLGEVSPDRVVRLARELGVIEKEETDYSGQVGLEALVRDRESRGRWKWERETLSNPQVQARTSGDYFSSGPIRSRDEFTIEDHDGVPFYPIGSTAPGHPDQYVLEVLPQSRTLIVGSEAHLYAVRAYVRDVIWSEPNPRPFRSRTLQVRSLRHGSVEVPAHLFDFPGGIAEVEFLQPLAHLSPGQTLVFIEADQVLGSGIVVEATRGARPELPIETGVESE